MAREELIEVRVSSDGTSIVMLRGEHDLCSRPEVTRALVAACFRPNVVVDLSDCTFIDSSVISAVLAAAKRLHQRDGQLELVIASEAIRRVVRLMGIERILCVHETCAAALACVGAAVRGEEDGAQPGARERGLRLRAISELIADSEIDNGDGAYEPWVWRAS
jgi:anti-sigma B factor antagonist